MSALNRRTLVGAAALAPLIAFSCAEPAPARSRRAWERAKKGYEEAESALARQGALLDALGAEVDAIAPMPSLTIQATASSGQTAAYHLPANDLHRFDDHPSLVVQQEAARVRGLLLRHREAETRMGVPEAEEKHAQLSGSLNKAEKMAVHTPAPDHAALLWKMALLFGPAARDIDGSAVGWDASFLDAVMEDAGRLLGRQATGGLA